MMSTKLIAVFKRFGLSIFRSVVLTALQDVSVVMVFFRVCQCDVSYTIYTTIRFIAKYVPSDDNIFILKRYIVYIVIMNNMNDNAPHHFVHNVPPRRLRNIGDRILTETQLGDAHRRMMNLKKQALQELADEAIRGVSDRNQIIAALREELEMRDAQIQRLHDARDPSDSDSEEPIEIEIDDGSLSPD